MGNQSPLGTRPLWNTEGLSLPGPFRSLVRHLMADNPGWKRERAIATAWSRTRHWAAKGNARWTKVLAQLEAARVKARATPNKSEKGRGVSASRPPSREVLMATTKNSPPAQGGKNTAGGPGKGTGGPPRKPGGSAPKTVADVRNAVAAIKTLPPPLQPKALDRVRAAARGIPGALAFVPASGGSGDGKK